MTTGAPPLHAFTFPWAIPVVRCPGEGCGRPIERPEEDGVIIEHCGFSFEWLPPGQKRGRPERVQAVPR